MSGPAECGRVCYQPTRALMRRAIVAQCMAVVYAIRPYASFGSETAHDPKRRSEFEHACGGRGLEAERFMRRTHAAGWVGSPITRLLLLCDVRKAVLIQAGYMPSCMPVMRLVRLGVGRAKQPTRSVRCAMLA
eukprot:1791507-Rhodomonas_salina.4